MQADIDTSLPGETGGDPVSRIKCTDMHPGGPVSPAQAVNSPYRAINTLVIDCIAEQGSEEAHI